LDGGIDDNLPAGMCPSSFLSFADEPAILNPIKEVLLSVNTIDAVRKTTPNMPDGHGDTGTWGVFALLQAVLYNIPILSWHLREDYREENNEQMR